jgi:hypothetical protein
MLQHHADTERHVTEERHSRLEAARMAAAALDSRWMVVYQKAFVPLAARARLATDC